MKASAMRELTSAELMKKLEEADRELFLLRIKVSQQRNTSRIRELRRDIARLKATLDAQGVRV
ncbi:MAG: 50S ribosomal protein L29 [Armatimonadetes bacterium]|nr:50S ribosomal protein L29 [Armatimonadota bacterium]